ncbi:MAG: hypothetical protein ACI841_000141 [Planctomycetota bacterium]|jgi:hypothetical protein
MCSRRSRGSCLRQGSLRTVALSLLASAMSLASFAQASEPARADAPARAATHDASVVERIASASRSSVEATLDIAMLSNGDFSDPPAHVRDRRGLIPIPWWKSSHGATQLIQIDGAPALRTAPGQFARQAIAAYADTCGAARIMGRVTGKGILSIFGSSSNESGEVGARAQARLPVGSEGLVTKFNFSLADLRESFGGQIPIPRFELMLEADPASVGCAWADMQLIVPWPAPSVGDLRRELETELEWIIDLWLERSRDDVGPEQTAFPSFVFDIKTGKRLMAIDGGHNSFADLLAEVMEVHPRDEWAPTYRALCEDLLTRAIHPATGLPRMWDVTSDTPKNGQGVEIARHLSFLIDLSETGPIEVRERARDAAMRVGESVLSTGLMPDGAVAMKFRPADGVPNTHLVNLRDLDVAAQLGRLGKISGDIRYLDAAREAAATVEYTHYWPGSWSDVDPGFDDQYGHYGKRAVTLWNDWPQEVIFRRIARGGFEYDEPWRDACRLGGNVAADQVRCWGIALKLARLDESLEERVARCLAAAVRAHLQGEQYGNGAWGDVTVFGFDPQDHLQVGDLPGAPQNLLQGLAWLASFDLTGVGGPSEPELRSWFTGVFRSSRTAYKRSYGYLSTRVEAAGANPARGSIGIAHGIVSMLRHLKSLDGINETDGSSEEDE